MELIYYDFRREFWRQECFDQLTSTDFWRWIFQYQHQKLNADQRLKISSDLKYKQPHKGTSCYFFSWWHLMSLGRIIEEVNLSFTSLMVSLFGCFPLSTCFLFHFSTFLHFLLSSSLDIITPRYWMLSLFLILIPCKRFYYCLFNVLC